LPIEKCIILCYNTSEEKERKEGKLQWDDKFDAHKSKERMESSNGKMINLITHNRMKGWNIPMRS